MVSLGLTTPPQEYDSRVRQSIDGIPCDIFAGKNINGSLTYYGQFVLNNEKSKSSKIFGMEGVKDAQDNAVTWDCPIALEALDNNSPMTLFHPAGSADSQALSDQLAMEFDKGFEFNFPEDAKWDNIDEGQWDAGKNKWSVKPLPGARAAIKRWLGWIYDCVPSEMRLNPEYGTQQGWSDESKAKWVSNKFKTEINDYFDLAHLLTYYIFIDYLAGKDQLVKNILWRTWDGLKWFPKYYDGDTWEAIRNDAFIVYLYNITRDSYDFERSKYAFEGHSSWLWCLVLANFEDELKQCAADLRTKLTNQAMLDEFLGNMIGNWSSRQYNKSCKLKYIDTIDRMNYVYTLTGSREEHIRQFITDRARLLDARYGVGNYNGDVITFTVVRQSTDTQSSLTLKSGDLYYFGYKLNGLWLQGPSKAAAGESLTLNFTQTLATNDPLMLGGASCIKELDFTNMGSQLNGTVGLSLCTMLSKLIMPATYGVANAPLTLGDISKLEYVDISGQTAVHTGTVGVFDLSKHTRLTTLLAGGTNLTQVILPEGTPLQTLTLPATIQTLTLRYLPKLYQNGLTLQGTANITALNFAECPNLSWQTLLTQCPNIDHVRIEGMSGRVRSAMLRPFMSGYRGLTADGQEQTYPALIGRVQLIDDVEDFDDMKAFFEKCGLTVVESQYTDYVFHDEETDPANISNESAQTGYGHQTAYAANGSVVKIHDASWPVMAYINPSTHKMHIELLSKSNLGKYIDNIHDQNVTGDADITGNDSIVSRDVFLLLTRYYYKGVNDYMNAEKHFLLSHLHTEPDSTSSRTRLLPLTELTKYDGSVPVANNINIGSAIGSLLQVSGYDTYRVDVEGYRQVRFPGMNDNYTCIVFTDENGTVVAKHQLWMAINISGNPMDFDNTIGDYVFLSVPDNAKYLYFCVPTAISALYNARGEVPQGELDAVEVNGVVTGYYAVLLTDSSEIEAIEPRWVEHKPELIGIYQGWANSNRGNMAVGNTNNTGKFTLSGPLRSISGKITLRGNGDGDNGVTGNWTYDTDGNPTAMPTGTCSGTAADFLNLASVRTAQSGVVNGEYRAVTYETSKDMANLLMVYFGTRDIENIVGMGGTPAYTTGTRNSVAYGNTVKSGTAGNNNTNQLNKMWGLEGWTGSMYEWVDGGCFNAPSFRQYLKDKRPKGTDTTPAAYAIDYRYNILQQDGKERRVKAATDNQRTNVARVRFGRYCDIVVSSYAGDGVYATCYAAFQSSGNNGSTVRKGLVLGRSSSSANASAGVAYSYTNNVSAYASTGSGARLCFFGELENEDVLIE